jgi:O-antigen ligase
LPQRLFRFVTSSSTTASLPQRIIEVLAVALLGLGLATAQVLIGGTRLLWSLPAYGIVALAAVLLVFLLRRAKPTPDTLCLVGTAIFFGYLIGRALISPAPYAARTDLYIMLGSLLVYGITVTVFTGAKSRMIFLGFLLLLGLAHVLVGAIQFRDGNNFMPIPFLQREDYGERASGFYVCPNHLAGLLEVIAIFAVSIVCWSRIPVWGKLLIGYAAVVCYAGTALTGSRGGYLSVAASLLVFVILSLIVLRGAGGSLVWKISGASLLVLLLAGAAVFFAFRSSTLLSSRAGNIAEMDNIRLDLWQAGLEQWKLSPIVGTGAATYRYYGRQFRTERMQLDPLEVHNDYIQLLAEYGLAGAAGFLIFFASHARAAWRDFRRLGPKRVAVAARLVSNNLAMQLGAIAAVASYVVHSVLDFNLHIPANALLLAFVYGVIANPGVRGGSEPQRPSLGWMGVRLAVVALGLLMLVQCARLLPGEYYAERARTSLRDRRLADAVRYALEGLAWERGNPDLYAYLGRARLGYGYRMQNPAAQRSFYNAAIEAFEAARALAPREQAFALTLGLLYDFVGRFDDGEASLKAALELDPKSVAVQQYYEAHLERRRAAQEAPAAPPPEPAATSTE